MLGVITSIIKHHEKTGYLNQLLLTMAASLGYLTIGLVRGFSSPGMPSMMEKSPYLVPTKSAISWVSAVPPLGAFIGSLVAGPLLQTFGRKHTLMLSAPVFVLGWSMIGLAVNLPMLVFARALTGFCCGIVTPSAQVYVSECAHPEIRGILGSLPALFMAIGVLISYILGTWLPWDFLAFASALFPLSLFFFLIPLPESPSWLRSKGHKEKAEKSAEWLRHQPYIANVELYTIPSSLEENMQRKSVIVAEVKDQLPANSAKAKIQGAYSREALFRRPVLVPFGLVIAILVFQQVSGIDTIIFYTVYIFHASKSSVGDYAATILVGLVQVIATFLSIIIIDKSGRKPLLIVSGFFMAISMAVLGLYFYAHNHHLEIADTLGYVPVISSLVFIAAFSVGYCNIPFLLMGELLPLAQRSLLSSVAGACNLGSMFVIIKTFPDIEDWLGLEGAFWLYAVFCAVSCVFVISLLPETKGKSLEEIEHYFENKERLKQKKKEAKRATVESSN